METSSQVSVRRLNWAGVEIVRDQQRILIDPVENAEPFEHLLAAAAEREKVQVNWVRENDLIRKSASEY